MLFAIGSDEWASSATAREWLQLAGVPKARGGLALCLVRPPPHAQDKDLRCLSHQ